MLLWDNLNPHVSAAMRELVATRVWLHVIRLPAYAPDLNPTEGVCGRTSNAASATCRPRRHQLLTIIRYRLKRIQYCTDLIDGFLAHTGLSLELNST